MLIEKSDQGQLELLQSRCGNQVHSFIYPEGGAGIMKPQIKLLYPVLLLLNIYKTATYETKKRLRLSEPEGYKMLVLPNLCYES